MVILGKKFGRLANRLWIFAYFYANSIEYNYKLFYRNFDEYNKYFTTTLNNQFPDSNIKSKFSTITILDNVLYLISQAIIEIFNKIIPHSSIFLRIKKEGQGLDLNDPFYLDKTLKKILIIRDGGHFYRDNVNLIKHRKKLLKVFRPKDIFIKNLENNIYQNKKVNSILVGVHLRKYDYRTIRNGEFFITDEQYKFFMDKMELLLSKENKKAQFLLCSDEKIDLQNFDGLNVFSGTGHLIEDLYSFAKCDYLMGPPSSYTMWASFYGNVNLLMLTSSTSIESLDQFEVTNSIDRLIDYFYNS